MARAVATTSRTGLVARWAKNAPPSKPSRSVGVMTIRKSRRNGWSRVARLFVLRPTCRTDPSANRIAATVKSLSSSLGMRGQTAAVIDRFALPEATGFNDFAILALQRGSQQQIKQAGSITALSVNSAA